VPRTKKTIAAEPVVEVETIIIPEPEPEVVVTVPKKGIAKSKGVDILPVTPEDTVIAIKAEKKKNKDIESTTVTQDIVSDTSEPVEKVVKIKFKEIHIKDSCWLENDIYQTVADMTKSNKVVKASLINQALKDYFKKHKVPIQSFRENEIKN